MVKRRTQYRKVRRARARQLHDLQAKGVLPADATFHDLNAYDDSKKFRHQHEASTAYTTASTAPKVRAEASYTASSSRALDVAAAQLPLRLRVHEHFTATPGAAAQLQLPLRSRDYEYYTSTPGAAAQLHLPLRSHLHSHSTAAATARLNRLRSVHILPEDATIADMYARDAQLAADMELAAAGTRFAANETTTRTPATDSATATTTISRKAAKAARMAARSIERKKQYWADVKLAKQLKKSGELPLGSTVKDVMAWRKAGAGMGAGVRMGVKGEREMETGGPWRTGMEMETEMDMEMETGGWWDAERDAGGWWDDEV
ncbi:hypothetical protein BDV95DRAFT_657787 [Massariosphaeria phaeospora]|uniref:Uncharacterized protein n=1 Tax=Massariosphaeria phaeospora TaxID=100035 RepID=A0A7C8I9K0_9PLEO|nr:hypothetical protein BDV95DRAFT_657787 [Massariosphaeria phaeospora]